MGERKNLKKKKKKGIEKKFGTKVELIISNRSLTERIRLAQNRRPNLNSTTEIQMISRYSRLLLARVCSMCVGFLLRAHSPCVPFSSTFSFASPGAGCVGTGRLVGPCLIVFWSNLWLRLGPKWCALGIQFS